MRRRFSAVFSQPDITALKSRRNKQTSSGKSGSTTAAGTGGGTSGSASGKITAKSAPGGCGICGADVAA